MLRWRTWFLLVAVAALAPALLWASPFGPARDLPTRFQLFLYGYPAWLVLSMVWLLPGIALARQLNWKPWYVVPWTAVLTQLAIGSISHWPPSRWWPVITAGQPDTPSGYLFRFPLEAWQGYLYSLWAQTFIAWVAAVALLITLVLLRPNTSLERSRER